MLGPHGILVTDRRQRVTNRLIWFGSCRSGSSSPATTIVTIARLRHTGPQRPLPRIDVHETALGETRRPEVDEPGLVVHAFVAPRLRIQPRGRRAARADRATNPQRRDTHRVVDSRHRPIPPVSGLETELKASSAQEGSGDCQRTVRKAPRISEFAHPNADSGYTGPCFHCAQTRAR